MSPWRTIYTILANSAESEQIDPLKHSYLGEYFVFMNICNTVNMINTWATQLWTVFDEKL